MAPEDGPHDIGEATVRRQGGVKNTNAVAEPPNLKLEEDSDAPTPGLEFSIGIQIHIFCLV